MFFKKLVTLECSRNKQNAINIIASIINLMAMPVLGFFLSPYIVKTIGVEANGFVNLANNFISYASLAKAALDSMASRFIMVAYYRGENEKVEQYYSSLLFGDALLSLILVILAGCCIWKLEFLLKIPENILTDVRILFALLFANFLVSTSLTAWNVAPYVKNKLYLDYLTNMLSSIARAIVLVSLFLFLSPKIYFIGIGTISAGILTQGLRFFYKKSLLPDLKAKRKSFSWNAVVTLVSSGIWNSISMLGNTLMNGFDLLLANVFVGATNMGILSLAKVFPGLVDEVNLTITLTFSPSLTMDYAKGRKESLVKTIRQASKIVAVLCSLPLTFLLVYGKEFFSLWQPTQSAQLLHILSVITVFGQAFFSGTRPLYQIFPIVNKVRTSSLINVGTGIVSMIITVLLLKFSSLGLYAIAGVSVACVAIKNLLFVIPWSAEYLGLNKRTFFFTVGYSMLPCVILCVLGSIEKMFLHGGTWIQLFVAGIIFVGVGLVINMFVVLNAQERAYLIQAIRHRK